MFFRRKRAVEPLVVETCWPTKRARIGGFRKKRTEQIVFSCAKTVQSEPPEVDLAVEAVPPKAVVDVHSEVVQTEVLDVVQTEVLDETESVQTEVVQTESVQMQIEAVLDSIPAQGRAVVGGPPETEDPKKTRSINDLLGIEPETSKGTSKKQARKKKPSAKKK